MFVCAVGNEAMNMKLCGNIALERICSCEAYFIGLSILRELTLTKKLDFLGEQNRVIFL